MLIVIDPGHGGEDPGAVGYRNREAGEIRWPTEANLNTQVSHLLAAALAGLGHTVEMTRLGDDETVSLPMRCVRANHLFADLFVSIHHNSVQDPAAHGFEVLIYRQDSPAAELARRIVEVVFRRFTEPGRLKMRGIQIRPNLAVLRGTHMPAVLVEVGFVSNPHEEIVLNLPDFQAEMADALAGAIHGWLTEEKPDA